MLREPWPTLPPYVRNFETSQPEEVRVSTYVRMAHGSWVIGRAYVRTYVLLGTMFGLRCAVGGASRGPAMVCSARSIFRGGRQDAVCTLTHRKSEAMRTYVRTYVRVDFDGFQSPGPRPHGGL